MNANLNVSPKLFWAAPKMFCDLSIGSKIRVQQWKVVWGPNQNYFGPIEEWGIQGQPLGIDTK